MLKASPPVRAQLDLARAHAGLVQVALHHAVADIAAGRLMRVLADVHDPDEREIHLHYLHRQFLSLRVRVVVDTMLAAFAASDGPHRRPQGWAGTARRLG